MQNPSELSLKQARARGLQGEQLGDIFRATRIPRTTLAVWRKARHHDAIEAKTGPVHISQSILKHA